jgi:hypothetical protein
MSIRDKLAGWAHQARTGAEDRAPTTAEQRHRRADWGQALIQIASLLHSIGSGLIAHSYEDAEHATETAYDSGYEQHREDAARPGKDDVDEDQAAGQLRDFSDPIEPAAGVTQYPIPRQPAAAAEPAADEG